MLKILSVVGARPNFIKIAPLHKALLQNDDVFVNIICHTGQHFDRNMSRVFFDELGLPKPDYHLGVGSGSHADQTARIMSEFEKVLVSEKPDLVIVPGDVNSTLACSLVAAKMGIKIAHVEAGLRSFDRSMPEEINRIVTDLLADFLFVSEPSGLTNLKKEGIPDEKVFFVGNIMIDSLIAYLPGIRLSPILSTLGLDERNYVVVTFHRPANVDSPDNLEALVELLNQLSSRQKIVFPVHPRTRIQLNRYNLDGRLAPGIILLDPVGYFDFMQLVRNASLVVTDSGGIQEETTFLGVQCVTVRDNTERPVTIEKGTNHLAGTHFPLVEKLSLEVLDGKIKPGTIPDLWDGRTAERIVGILKDRI